MGSNRSGLLEMSSSAYMLRFSSPNKDNNVSNLQREGETTFLINIKSFLNIIEKHIPWN